MQVNLDGQSLPVHKLKGTDTTLDLSRKKLRDTSAIVLAALLRHNTRLTSLSIASNPIGEDGMRAMGTALLKSTVSKLGALKCDAFEVRAGEAALDMSRKRLPPGAKALLAGVVNHNPALRTFSFREFTIRDDDNAPKLTLSSKGLDDGDVAIVAGILGRGGCMAQLQVRSLATAFSPDPET